MSDTEPSNRILLPTRRKILTTAVVGAAVSVQTSQGFLFRQCVPMKLDTLPQEWVRKEGEQKIQSYAKYLDGLRLKYVTPLQVIEAHAKKRGSVWNSLPPKSMWRGMANTLKATDHVAATLGRPVKEVTSAYRSPAYNRRCPGAKTRSWHLQNIALDLKFAASTGSVAAAARRVRSRGIFEGGIGRYGAFTHIDTRGKNVDW